MWTACCSFTSSGSTSCGFFFSSRRRHTRLQGDWSSDVCSSDLIDRDAARLAEVQARFPDVQVSEEPARAFSDPAVDAVVVATPTSTHFTLAQQEIGRASCRERV